MTNQSGHQETGWANGQQHEKLDDIKDFKSSSPAVLPDTAPEAEMEEHIPKHNRKGRQTHKAQSKRESVNLRFQISRDRIWSLSCTNHFKQNHQLYAKGQTTTGLSKPSRTFTTSTSQAAWFPESLTTSWMTSPLGRTGHWAASIYRLL